MQRSLPGLVTGRPATRIAPVVGSISPATRRRRLDLPQPEGPTITENSLSATPSEMWSRACTGLPLRGVNRSETSSISSLLMNGPGAGAASRLDGPGQETRAQQLEELIGQEPKQTD